MIIIEKLYELLKEDKNHFLFVDENCYYSVKDVELLSGKVYSYLKNNNINKEDFILIKLDRSAIVYPIIIGIIKAGAAYTIVENDIPSNRIENIIKDINPKLVIDKKLLKEIESYEYKEGYVDINNHDAAYAIYTSGTTGVPKCIIHEYGDYDKAIKTSLIDESLLQKYDSRFALLCPLNFIVSIYALSCAMYCGAMIYIPSYKIIKNSDELIKYFIKNKINETFMAPSLLHLLKDKLPDSIRLVITGSDIVSNISLKNVRLFNFYMMSECGFLISKYEITKEEAITPVGKPNEYVDIKINNNGELLVKNEFCRCEYENEYYFNTHDVVGFDEFNNYVIKGRTNDMVKINGNRIEPVEIENLLKRITGIEFVVKCFNENVVAYYTSNKEIDEKEIRFKLNDLLPYYMIPSIYSRIDDFTLTEMEKIDRKALPYPAIVKEEYIKPNTNFEITLVKALKKYYKNEEIGIKDDLFKYGLNSIEIIDLISNIKMPGLEAKHFYSGRTIKDIEILYEQDLANSLSEEEKEKIGRKMEFAITDAKHYQIAMLNMKYEPTTFYNLPSAYCFKLIDIKKLKKIMNDYMSNSSLFNTQLYFKDDIPHQKYVDGLFTPIEIEEKTEEDIEEIKKNFIRPFVLSEEKPYRVRLIKVNKDTYLFFDIHHSIIDGLGLNLLFNDILSLYFNKKTNYTSNYFAYLYDSDKIYKSEKTKRTLLNNQISNNKNDYVSTYLNEDGSDEVEYHIEEKMIDISLTKLNDYLKSHSITRLILFNAVELLTLKRLTGKKKTLSYYMYSNRTGNNNHTGFRAETHFVTFDFDDYTNIDCLYKEIKRQIDNSLQCPNIGENLDFNKFTTGIIMDDLGDITNVPKVLKKIMIPIKLENPFYLTNKSPIYLKCLWLVNKDPILKLRFGCDVHFMSIEKQRRYLDTYTDVLKEILN